MPPLITAGLRPPRTPSPRTVPAVPGYRPSASAGSGIDPPLSPGRSCEVARAARRFEYREPAQPLEKRPQPPLSLVPPFRPRGAGLDGFRTVQLRRDSGLLRFRLEQQGADHHRFDQQNDLVPVGVVRPELGALAGIGSGSFLTHGSSISSIRLFGRFRSTQQVLHDAAARLCANRGAAVTFTAAIPDLGHCTRHVHRRWQTRVRSRSIAPRQPAAPGAGAFDACAGPAVTIPGSMIVRRPRADFGSPNRGSFPARSSVWRSDSVPASRFHGIPRQTERLIEAQTESDRNGQTGLRSR